MNTKKILISPLDWGLGHTTRCIPIIRELKECHCEIIIAAEGASLSLLKKEFPDATFIKWSGYRVRYTKNEYAFGLKMLTQLPKIRKAIQKEHHRLKKIVRKYQPDAIISDNRFGMHHADIPSVILTHQLRILSPFGKFGENLLQKINYHYLNKFQSCWVVDFEDKAQSLAGILSHPKHLPHTDIKYIGALSRFEKTEVGKNIYDLLVLISGPEPQRSIFEKLVCSQLKNLSIHALVVTGRPDKSQSIPLTSTIKIVHHLDSPALQKAIGESRMVLCRPGYTSVMDLIKLKKKAIFVPTPGQTEQEYLSEWLWEKGYFPSFPQKNFQIEIALKNAGKFPFLLPDIAGMNQYKQVVREWISGL